MACHALGRCRICAQRHKIDVFGGEKDQHYMIEKADLKLIILNTVCVVCIGKIERFVKKIDPNLIFGDYIKDQNLCEDNDEVEKKETEIAKRKISSKIVLTTDRRENNDEESVQYFGNTTAMEVDLKRRLNNKPNLKSDVTDRGNNLPDFSTSRDTQARLAVTARPRIDGKSGTSVPINFHPSVKSQPGKEALAKRIFSRLGVNGRKRPLDDSDESQVVKSVTSRIQKVGEDADESKTSSSAESISETLKINNEDLSTSSKKAGRYLVCDFCKKTFTHAGDLNKHRRKHTGEKPYECGECKRKFAHASNLARHQRVHSGERPFLCPRCDRGFTRRDKLTIHVAGGRCQINNSTLNNAKSTVAVV